MNNNKTYLIIILIAIVTFLFIFNKNSNHEPKYEDPITEEQVYYSGVANENLIKVNSPKPNSKVSSPLKISGEARGTWYFEGDFPIILTNWDGLIIAEGYGRAKGDWMVSDFVPFEAFLEFDKPECSQSENYCKRGSIILQKDNPSDLREYDGALEFTVWFE